MQPGSAEHKHEYLESLVKHYHEEIWRTEIVVMELEKQEGRIRTELAEIDLKLERKEYKTANQGQKEKERKESDLEAIRAAIQKSKDDMSFSTKRLELVCQYAEKK